MLPPAVNSLGSWVFLPLEPHLSPCLPRSKIKRSSKLFAPPCATVRGQAASHGNLNTIGCVFSYFPKISAGIKHFHDSNIKTLTKKYTAGGLASCPNPLCPSYPPRGPFSLFSTTQRFFTHMQANVNIYTSFPPFLMQKLALPCFASYSLH